MFIGNLTKDVETPNKNFIESLRFEAVNKTTVDLFFFFGVSIGVLLACVDADFASI